MLLTRWVPKVIWLQLVFTPDVDSFILHFERSVSRMSSSRIVLEHQCITQTRKSPLRLPLTVLGSASDDMDKGTNEVDEDEYCQVRDEFGCMAVEALFEGEDETDFRWIRVEKDTDLSLSKIETPSDVFAQIEKTKLEQGEIGRSDLYRRRWVSLDDCSEIDKGINGDSVDGTAKTFSVMQFNALAEGLSSGPAAKKPFRVNPDDKHAESEKLGKGYGGFTNIPSPETTLDFSKRRWRLLEVILSGGGDSLFDLIAMEEVDRFVGFFLPMLQLFGYEGLFVPKARSPGVRMGWYSDGCCLFWKKESFELISERRNVYSVGSQVYMIVVLKHLPTNHVLVVAVTHLKAQKSEANEKIRCRQIEELLAEIAGVVAQGAKNSDGGISALILGDFNADPPSNVTLFEESAVQLVLDCNLHAITGSPFELTSAYEMEPPPPSFYTTWKTRGAETVRRIIDYIFYGGSLRCEATLEVPSEDELESARLPGLRHPSDHMMIAAKFRIEID